MEPAGRRATPALGQYIACLEVPDDANLEIEQTGRAGHYTLWGPPGALLALVVSVEPVDAVD